MVLDFPVVTTIAQIWLLHFTGKPDIVLHIDMGHKGNQQPENSWKGGKEE